MKRIIIYNSKTGFALKYAKWLSNDLAIEMISFKEGQKLDLSEYDEVIYVASIFASMVRGLSKMVEKSQLKLVVLAVGYTDMSEKYIAELKTANKFEGPLYYAKGGINYEKLGFLSRTMLKKITKQLTSIDCSDVTYLKDIEDYLSKA